MKTEMMMAVSAMALMLATPVMAQNYPLENTSATTTTTTTTYDMGTATTKPDVSGREIRAAVVDEAGADSPPTYLTIDRSTTAGGFIGKPVYDTGGKEIAKIDDLIVDKSGQVTTAVLANGRFLGIGGKLAGFDYNLITQRNDKGDIVAPLGEEAIKQAYSYSYSPKDAGENTRIMPATSYRLSRILDANLIDPENSKIANVDNASLRNGQVDYLIAGFDKTLGIGGKKAAIKYNAVSMTTAGNHLDFRLTGNQAYRLKNLSKMNLSSK